MYKIYIGLGANIEPVKHLSLAVQALQKTFTQVRISPCYRSAAVFDDTTKPPYVIPEFINLALTAQTTLTKKQVQSRLKAIEKSIEPQRPVLAHHHRIDIDLYAHAPAHSPVIVPLKTELLTCAYALRPIVDIEPEIATELQPLSEYLANIAQTTLTPLDLSHLLPSPQPFSHV